MFFFFPPSSFHTGVSHKPERAKIRCAADARCDETTKIERGEKPRGERSGAACGRCEVESGDVICRRSPDAPACSSNTKRRRRPGKQIVPKIALFFASSSFKSFPLRPGEPPVKFQKVKHQVKRPLSCKVLRGARQPSIVGAPPLSLCHSFFHPLLPFPCVCGVVVLRPAKKKKKKPPRSVIM